MSRRLLILGSTGSIGTQALELLERSDELELVGLSARGDWEALVAQAQRFGVSHIALADPDAAARAGEAWTGGEVLGGPEGLVELVIGSGADLVLNALVGSAGLGPTVAALGEGIDLALANKESLVAGGPLVLAAARSGGGELVPIDSEHSAILQCLEGAEHGCVSRVVLTASGGPFRGWNTEELRDVRPEQALRHPTWDMGAKITIDSATLANKALEVIEAHFLYRLPYEAIGVVVHPQSIVHSFVEFVDGSVMAQMGLPTMELPILYALSWPERIADARLRTFDPVAASPLTFEEVDHRRFPLFGLGVEAGRAGGTAPAVFNAANEVAVEAFLQGRVGFLEIAEVVASALEALTPRDVTEVDDVLDADRSAREAARGAVARNASPRPSRGGGAPLMTPTDSTTGA
ncbi:MAG: 1-deoxy-D-xylulose-5-phosphate reductoisomerase [Gemmatimonadetes bacterium]|nr:1-deoxy-D-xylulose-5-phosphate reductoisomerase [Gemmatimonadota bacterium]